MSDVLAEMPITYQEAGEPLSSKREFAFPDPEKTKQKVIEETFVILDKTYDALGFSDIEKEAELEEWSRARKDFEEGRMDGEGNQIIYPQELAAHRFYHVAKVGQLAAFAAVAMHQRETNPLTLAEARVMLAAARDHDHGVLVKARDKEKKPDIRAIELYGDHEQRSVDDARAADKDSLELDLIRMTSLRFGSIFVQNGDLKNLPPLRERINNNDWDSDQDWMALGSQLAREDKERFFELARVFLACDNLAYACDPVAPFETAALYQESSEILEKGVSPAQEKRFGDLLSFLTSGYSGLVQEGFSDVLEMVGRAQVKGVENRWLEYARQATERIGRLEANRKLPKAEGRVHFEGALSPSTLLEIAKRNGVAVKEVAKRLRETSREILEEKHFSIEGLIGKLSTSAIREMLNSISATSEEVAEADGNFPEVITRKRKKLIAEITHEVKRQAVLDGVTFLSLAVSPGAFRYREDEVDPKAELMREEDFLKAVRDGLNQKVVGQPAEREAAFQSEVWWTIRKDRWSGQGVKQNGKYQSVVFKAIEEGLIDGVNLGGKEEEDFADFDPFIKELIRRRIPASVYVAQTQEDYRNKNNLVKALDWAELAQKQDSVFRLSDPALLARNLDLLDGRSFTKKNPLVAEMGLIMPLKLGSAASLEDHPFWDFWDDERVKMVFSSGSPQFHAVPISLYLTYIQGNNPALDPEEFCQDQLKLVGYLPPAKIA